MKIPDKAISAASDAASDRTSDTVSGTVSGAAPRQRPGKALKRTSMRATTRATAEVADKHHEADTADSIARPALAASADSDDPADSAATAAADEPAVSLSDRLARGDLMAVACPSRDVLRHLTSRWGVLVLIALQSGTLRFSDLRRRIGGVSERMLAQTLQWLEGDGMLQRRAYPVVPPHVDYTLTPLGQEAATRVKALADWIEVSLPRIASQWGDDDQRPM